MGSRARASNNIWIGRRAMAVAAATIGLVTVVAGGTSVQAAPVAPDAPEDVTVECDELPAPVPLTATDSEAADITVFPVDDRTDGDSTHEYVIERTWTFVAGDPGLSVSQTITVEDTTAPVFDDVPAAVRVGGSAAIPAAAALDATDNCEGALQSDLPADVAVGTGDSQVITRTWTVSDEAGNVETATQTITVVPPMTASASAVITQSGQELAAGDPVDITIQVENKGPSDATDATLTATFTNNIGNLTISSPGLYACQINLQVLSCTRASHPVGTNAVISLRGALTGSSTNIFDSVTVDSAEGEPIDARISVPMLIRLGTTTTIAETDTTTSIAETTTTEAETTTTIATTTTAAPAVTTAPPTGGSIPATGTDNSNVIRASIIALLLGLAAVIVARRRPDLVPAFLTPRTRAELPVRRITSNGVSTVIEEPKRDPHKR